MPNFEDDDLGDELGDALNSSMTRIARCMKNGISPEDCALQLMDDPEFMSQLGEDEMDKIDREYDD